MKKILVFGSLNFDNIYRVPHITAAGETQASTDMTIRLGGKGYNQAAAAWQFGWQAALGRMENRFSMLAASWESMRSW